MAILEFESPLDVVRLDAIGLQNGFTHVPGIGPGAPDVYAFVNHGRWIGRCPYCSSARGVQPNVNYWCPDCGMVELGGQEAPIVWPGVADVDLADDLLAVRPKGARNWDPSPTAPVPGRTRLGELLIEDVAVENLERGLDIPRHVRRGVEEFLEIDWIERGISEEMRRFLVDD